MLTWDPKIQSWAQTHRPPGLKNKRCALKKHAEASIRNCKRSHIAQRMANNHFEGSLQNLGTYMRQEENSCFHEGKSCFQEGKSCFQGPGLDKWRYKRKMCVFVSIAKINIFEKKESFRLHETSVTSTLTAYTQCLRATACRQRAAAGSIATLYQHR